MSDAANAFVGHLVELAQHDRAALAILRRSLAFAPGAYPPAFPFIERYVGADRHAQDSWRRALYVVGGLFAQHPHHQPGTPFASRVGLLARSRGNEREKTNGIELRFVRLLGCDAEDLPDVMRQAVALLAADHAPFDFVRLLDDLARWLNPMNVEGRDQLRQRWAREFYQALEKLAEDDGSAVVTTKSE